MTHRRIDFNRKADQIARVPNRPCKPAADLQWIWQTLLPDVPFPTCEVPETSDAAKSAPKQGADATKSAAQDLQRQKRG